MKIISKVDIQPEIKFQIQLDNKKERISGGPPIFTMQDGKGNVRHRFKSPEINAVGGSVIEPYEETKQVSYD